MDKVNHSTEPEHSLAAARASSVLSWCGGATVCLVKDFPEERTRLATIGATVLFTGLFAVASSAYALYTVFGWSLWVPALAVLWGAMIFNLDRLIVMTIHGEPLRRLFAAIPRLFLATVVALIVARPLELWIFAPEIERSIALADTKDKDGATEAWKKSKIGAEKRYTDGIATVEALVKSDPTVTAARDCDSLLKQAVARYDAELSGSGGTGTPGFGPAAKQALIYLKQTQRRCEDSSTEAREALSASQETKSAAIEKYAEARDTEIETATQLLHNQLAALDSARTDSLLGRHRELTKLASDQPPVRAMTFFVTMLFWLVEVLPVASKLMSGDSIYEAIVFERLNAARIGSRGAQEAESEQLKAGREAALLKVQEMRAEAEAASSVRREALALHYQAISDVIRASREKWQPPGTEVDAAVDGLEALSRATLRQACVAVTRATKAKKYLRPGHRDHATNPVVSSGHVTLGLSVAALVTVAVLGTFVALTVVGPLPRTNLGISIGMGALITSLLTLRPFSLLFSRSSESEPPPGTEPESEIEGPPGTEPESGIEGPPGTEPESEIESPGIGVSQ